MSRFSAAEAEFLLDATFAFFWDELGDLDSVDDHGVGVMNFRGRGVGKGWYVWWEVLEFHLAISSARSHWVWKAVTFLYQLSMVEGTVSIDMIRHINAGGIPAEKYPIRTFGSEILVRVTWFLNVVIYSTSEGEYKLFFTFFCMRWVDSQEMAFPVTSWCLNAVLNFVMKSAKVPRVNEVPKMALWRKVEAHVRADPLVIYERVKAICFSSVS